MMKNRSSKPPIASNTIDANVCLYQLHHTNPPNCGTNGSKVATHISIVMNKEINAILRFHDVVQFLKK